jgi:site-specific DNA-methyltransferase (adenine-specific)
MSRRSRIRRQGWQLWEGDSLELLKQLPANSLDSMVTDPPAGISFMGKEWDKDKGGRDGWIAWLEGIMRECFRTLKPGAHALVWAIPRTSHWTATAIEKAGFEIRTIIHHHFGTGFPMSVDLGAGRGTAVRPSTEHWILVRKPIDKTLLNTVRTWGTGGINVAACHLGGDRWPADMVLSHSDDCIIAWRTETRSVPKRAFSFKTGEESPGYEVVFDGEDIICAPGCPVRALTEASQFFYCAKPDRGERDIGCGHLPWKAGGELTNRKEGSAGLANPRAGAGRTSGGRNLHPTCKSIRLMRWLCRLITPSGGTVLDPFTGSGSTGAAALAEGFHFLGMELNPEYAEIARARLGYVALHPSEVPDP